MITILVDHNIEGQAGMLLGTLAAMGWLELFPLQMKTLENVGLPFDSSDREVWRFAQANGMVLLTDNRRMKEKDSLEQTIREENTINSLPVLTIGNVRRIPEKTYRERCANRLLEILMDLENYLGTSRIFIP
jgi:predicted nuclease of predicted toxin-antitoxin system